ncbi:MAG: TetR/AcrR family transcriptional regulator [Bdellovibrionaceae bacterium]|nr:TetR/AcrR family transcriptional regulator [Pseudobdellovibrionaceae bacterium]MBX3032654.1 TetR/AcrR family transcriptional regulator [Pseudobdellovibrionaceae bacterium]
MKTKERILQTSIELFNRHGVGPMTTNHIAKAMEISPGNLYFHYDNKEEILREVFKRMCKETYEIWRPRRRSKTPSLKFIDENFELYWKYRFFHREMYALRRKDTQLARMWRTHIQKMMTLMQLLYRRWVREGQMVEIKDKAEMLYISESLLAMATTFLQFFESSERQPGRRSVERGKRHVARLMLPFAAAETRDELEKFIASAI